MALVISVCDTCGIKFELEQIGHDDCPSCVAEIANRREYDDMLKCLALDTSSALEEIRDMLDDALTLLIQSPRKNLDRSVELFREARDKATDSIPDPDDYFIEHK